MEKSCAVGDRHCKLYSELVTVCWLIEYYFFDGVRAAVFYGSSRISGRFSRLPFETNTGDTFSRILTSLNFVV